MDELNLLKDLAPYGQIGGLIVVVLLFLRHMRDERKDREAGHKERNEVIRGIFDQSNECHKKCAESMSQSAEVIRQNTAVIQRFNDRHHSGGHRAAAGD